MPEHETFDLDSAFASLERDIAGVSSPRGAGLAVSTARRRRRTTFGAAAAVALLTIGGVTVAQGLGHGASSVGPSGELPAPAPFDKAALTTATAGWASAWADPTKADNRAYNQLDLGCLDTITGGSAQDPDTNGDFAAVNADGGLAFGHLADFGTRAAAAATTWDALSTGIPQCGGVTTSGHLSWTDGEALSFTVTATKAGATDQHVWVAREGNTLALLWIGDQPGGRSGHRRRSGDGGDGRRAPVARVVPEHDDHLDRRQQLGSRHQLRVGLGHGGARHGRGGRPRPGTG